MKTQKSRLEKFYARFRGEDQVLVPINADPDAIASAMAIKRLLWRKVAGVSISNVNAIDRPDNLTMIRRLGLVLQPFEAIDCAHFTRFVMVDSQPDHHNSFSAFTPDVVIDHHPKTSFEAPFVDVRPQYGANASILTEYLRTAGIKPSTKLASGLFYAIKTDTSNFQRKTVIEDVRAFQFLYHHINPHLVRQIEQQELRLAYLKYFKAAFQVKRLRRGRLFVHLGNVENSDICVIIADFFMRVNSVNWSIVSGIAENRLVVIFRNDGMRKSAGRVAKESFGSLGSAGGHKGVARAEVEIEKVLENTRTKKAIGGWVIQRVEKRSGKS